MTKPNEPSMIEVRQPDATNRRPVLSHALTTPQMRVLRALAASKGPLTRLKIAQRCGTATPVLVSRAIGYEHAEKRKAFEKTAPGGYTRSLLSLGYVESIELDIDGITETAYRLTSAGRRALQSFEHIDLPPLRGTPR